MKLLKNLWSIIMLTALFPLGLGAQGVTTGGDDQKKFKDQATLEQQMASYVEEFMTDKQQMEVLSAQLSTGHQCHVLSPDEIDAMIVEHARQEFIYAHRAEYKRLFQDEFASMVTTSVCDNGGFESGFTGYSGFGATYNSGSSTCNPKFSGTPVTFSGLSLPTPKRLEVVNSGTDPLSGLPKTKFGSKALKINSSYGHVDSCEGDFGVDRITKEFTVTDETRDFTVWYAVVLENPSGHDDQQPFFHMSCDLAFNNDFCFDADLVSCEEGVSDSKCTFSVVDILEWSCYRFIIPEEEIGNTATLEITVGDCGEGDHFGYAYIDGICEGCTGSALGSVSLNEPQYCYEDTAIICGSYQLPDVCDEEWELDSLYVPNFTISDLRIDEEEQTFCFKFSESLFDTSECEDVYVEIVFTNGTVETPAQVSNLIEICDTSFQDMLEYVSVGSCQDNGTPDNISDDYYWVFVSLDNTNGASWSITQKLKNAYPGESRYRELLTGSGDAAPALGPFYIQEGDWEVIIHIGECIFEELVLAPDFCPDCEYVGPIVIDNIECNGSTWNYDLEITGLGSVELEGAPYSPSTILSKNTVHTIGPMSIGDGCQEYLINNNSGIPCTEPITFIVCPPIPCNVDCDLESVIEDITCEKDGTDVDFSVDLDVNNYSAISVMKLSL